MPKYSDFLKRQLQDGVAIDLDADPGAALDTITGGLVNLTDNSAGTANNTVEAMANIATAGGSTPTAAQVDTAVNGVLAKIRNNFADVAAKINAINGVVEELVTTVNALVAVNEDFGLLEAPTPSSSSSGV